MAIARSLRGMNDLFESDLIAFRLIEKSLEKIFHLYGYHEIRTPILEELALFARGVGETTDIVEKEMFLVKDGEHTYCLRPENTAPVARALIERGGINEETESKLYYVGPMFRKERPQKGRLRQFHQYGIELIGISEPSADIEVIAMIHHLISDLGLSGISLRINTLGLYDERARFREKLKDYLFRVTDHLCNDCQRRLQENPLRVLDCKNPHCHEIALKAPKILETLDPTSCGHFDAVLDGLTNLGISFELDPYLVRGLDYYSRTVFEFVADFGLGAQNAVVAGGRYDGLFKTLGNKFDLPAVGCAGGIERLILLLSNVKDVLDNSMQLALIGADDEGQLLVPTLAYRLRNLGIATDFCLVKKSLKAQMRRADKLNAEFVAVLGAQEINNKRVTLKGFRTKKNYELSLDAACIANFIQNEFKD